MVDWCFSLLQDQEIGQLTREIENLGQDKVTITKLAGLFLFPSLLDPCCVRLIPRPALCLSGLLL